MRALCLWLWQAASVVSTLARALWCIPRMWLSEWQTCRRGYKEDRDPYD